QQVAGQLLDGELIVWHVAIEGINYPITPAPHESLTVHLVTVAVGVSCRLQPRKRHTFTVARRIEQSIHNLLIGVRRRILEKRIDVNRRWWQPRQVQRDAPNQRRPVGLWRGRQSLSLEPL